MPRPTGVTVLAILYFIGTCTLVLLGVAAIAGMGFLGEMLAQNPDIGPARAAMIASAGTLFSVLFFALALVCFFVGYGLWNLRSWARTLAIVLSVIGAALAALGVIWEMLRFAPVGVIMSGIRLGVNILIAWYLNQPHIKSAFR